MNQPNAVQQPEEDDNAISLSWTWYLLLGACFLVVFGVALTWILIRKEVISSQIYYLPSLICSLIAIGCLIGFVYLDTKDFSLLKYHVPKKNFNIYFGGIATIAFSIIFSIVYLFFYQIAIKNGSHTDAFFLAGLIVTAILTLLGIGVYRYAKYKIDLAVYLRKHGKDVNKENKEETPVSDMPIAMLLLKPLQDY